MRTSLLVALKEHRIKGFWTLIQLVKHLWVHVNTDAHRVAAGIKFAFLDILLTNQCGSAKPWIRPKAYQGRSVMTVNSAEPTEPTHPVTSAGCTALGIEKHHGSTMNQLAYFHQKPYIHPCSLQQLRHAETCLLTLHPSGRGKNVLWGTACHQPLKVSAYLPSARVRDLCKTKHV